MSTKYNDDAEKILQKEWDRFFRTKKGKEVLKQAERADDFMKKMQERLEKTRQSDI